MHVYQAEHVHMGINISPHPTVLEQGIGPYTGEKESTAGLQYSCRFCENGMRGMAERQQQIGHDKIKRLIRKRQMMRITGDHRSLFRAATPQPGRPAGRQLLRFSGRRIGAKHHGIRETFAQGRHLIAIAATEIENALRRHGQHIQTPQQPLTE